VWVGCASDVRASGGAGARLGGPFGYFGTIAHHLLLPATWQRDTGATAVTPRVQELSGGTAQWGLGLAGHPGGEIGLHAHARLSGYMVIGVALLDISGEAGSPACVRTTALLCCCDSLLEILAVPLMSSNLHDRPHRTYAFTFPASISSTFKSYPPGAADFPDILGVPTAWYNFS
jgi:hypothetical protein